MSVCEAIRRSYQGVTIIAFNRVDPIQGVLRNITQDRRRDIAHAVEHIGVIYDADEDSVKQKKVPTVWVLRAEEACSLG